MVGASELAFRLLCRNYGATLAYTPMMSSSKFHSDSNYRADEFQTVAEDRPLVAHFSCNNPTDMVKCAKMLEGKVDAIDLNLGCPQRTAYVGHFGSYLLNPSDRNLIVSIIRETSKSTILPVFVKIRLLDTIDDTIQLCQQLRDAGASLIAIHARYRASFERKGAGARDGPALLEQVTQIKKVVTDLPIIANGNVITYHDVKNNLKLTNADGIMSAEGILDNPALYLPHLGENSHGNKVEPKNAIKVMVYKPPNIPERSSAKIACGGIPRDQFKKKRKFEKKLRDIQKIEEKVRDNGGSLDCLGNDQKNKLISKDEILQNLSKIEEGEATHTVEQSSATLSTAETVAMKPASLHELYTKSASELNLANEYLALVRCHPVKLRSVIFHIRRMCRDLLKKYQLMEDMISANSINVISALLNRCAMYEAKPQSFKFDKMKEIEIKATQEQKRREEGKRKAYEARMLRKAKREKLDDAEYYLRQGADVPSVQTVKQLKTMQSDEKLALWKKSHSQHCMSYHLDIGGCKRDRSCAFLHVNAQGINAFEENDEVAG
eukprot:CAMPEP_0194400372 /NCGR_PEP_ID=MMETSP0174-20130528/127182_1 /TAXON_ID=216777 /ORGANISM="Proboscia alata, Strain PI-D3" /LENGTH=549 /DNA_ID=CAMNT_0039196891 /DNA_START=555 /DNA_END=2204 /DNA_ORIENTATION=+